MNRVEQYRELKWWAMLQKGRGAVCGNFPSGIFCAAMGESKTLKSPKAAARWIAKQCGVPVPEWARKKRKRYRRHSCPAYDGNALHCTLANACRERAESAERDLSELRGLAGIAVRDWDARESHNDLCEWLVAHPKEGE